MSFFDTIKQYHAFEFTQFFNTVTSTDVERSLAKNRLNTFDFLTLLSPAAAGYLEAMAQKAHQITVQQFGRTIQIFIPLYISNHCTNHCLYCGFNHNNRIARRRLTLDEIEAEAAVIASTGMQHVLFLTGEAPHFTPMNYLVEVTRCLKRFFASVAIEIYPLEVEEYRQLWEAGADGMTLFQETYDQGVYQRVHPAGRKRDFHWRLNAPERAAQGGMRVVNIGPLLGLTEPRSEIFFTGLHAKYLEDRYLETEVAVSLPRFNQAEGNFIPDHLVADRDFVQFMTALRLFLPRAGLTISTRENAAFRDRLLPLGVTRYSAGSSTGVGGYAELLSSGQTPQFEITDKRSVAEVAAAIIAHGYQPVYKDWDRIE
ncbi:2-iminoacetate synthase ThiH [Desulfobulbus oligotrophicus]|jgi:2-iminoacetate synthase|uniref:2-iminoacetate synthase ThiH n=1 Tax=Desulfobulbus oligotrophicus TaxID=1909699 RepID=A0A7T5VEF7_9BACT|nr:2-iminoacetate synthase ThiH [Desulfobulbus oligotrophicus]MDY0391736.1 2-iminoacetate synthase ThiH [Desulfobulbus oligotrophicus]QQG66404.1 2-iminoacetate synthase ThiH [Desulfobulbus oligotrophicus]